MRLQTRLQPLEHRAGADHLRDDPEVVEIWLPDNGGGGLPLGRYPCPAVFGVAFMPAHCYPT
jgi:hypothetical protein